MDDTKDDSAYNGNQGKALESLKGQAPLGLLGPAGKGLTDPEQFGKDGVVEDVTDASAHVLGKGTLVDIELARF